MTQLKTGYAPTVNTPCVLMRQVLKHYQDLKQRKSEASAQFQEEFDSVETSFI